MSIYETEANAAASPALSGAHRLGGRDLRPLRILLVAGYFPPYAPFSATRVNAMARYFLERGHDVRVLAPKNIHFPRALAPEIPLDRILYTPLYEVLDLPGQVKDGLKRLMRRRSGKAGDAPPPDRQGAGEAAVPGPEAVQRSPAWKWALRQYNNLVSTPDPRVGWYPFGVRAGRELLAGWRADVIHASAPPYTSLLVAARLGRLCNIPWTGEYRDLWVDHPYYDNGPVKRALERWLEARTLRTAAGLVTVTRTWADWLRAKHPQQVELVMNGFDPADYPAETPPPLDPDRLTILYAGGLYHGKRDPSPLFEALALMGEEASRVRIVFHVAAPEEVYALADRYGVRDHLDVTGVIPRQEVIRRQCASDVLLLLRWNDPREDSVLAGKLFEYIGARRTILSIGSDTGEAADIIRDNNMGVVSNDPAEIAATLRDWLARKTNGRLPAACAEVDMFARSAQFERLESFLSGIAKKAA